MHEVKPPELRAASIVNTLLDTWNYYRSTEMPFDIRATPFHGTTRLPIYFGFCYYDGELGMRREMQ